MTKYNDPKSGKTVEATNMVEAKEQLGLIEPKEDVVVDPVPTAEEKRQAKLDAKKD